MNAQLNFNTLSIHRFHIWNLYQVEYFFLYLTQTLQNLDVRIWLVDVTLTRHVSSRSRRSAFLHRNPHVTHGLVNLCVSITFLLGINCLIGSITVYWISFLRRYRHTQPPFLLWHYPHSLVLRSCPTACYPSSFLARLYAVLFCTYSIRWLDRDNRLSPVDWTFMI